VPYVTVARREAASIVAELPSGLSGRVCAPAGTVLPMALAGRLGSIAFDCSDPAELASFWAELVGGEVAFASDDFCAVKTDGAWLAAVRVADYQPPTWPDPAVPKQMHLDLAVADLDAAEAEAIRLGARKPPGQPAPDRWRVLLDPAGHPFCLSSQIPE
jgi:Glyoxalase-like domain